MTKSSVVQISWKGVEAVGLNLMAYKEEKLKYQGR
jgi:hypothetical protein